ncbi:hypothetical protein A2716_02935 [candidate division WWE3 bacterium RIFCSPHIGHO2_01_FULL_40_23]|uniref:Antitoxin n=1 Tax=candidate division WWE3 bacterium RIFCSPLOWO2_01_FULL_41_18 TaxID=1802625 RepID=A0A1F4VCB5_UNCKA|nr:MAG: hypothetical protein A2716_02935 [candidate division WWE3 bacterium RIFCSPHIGHO2_01_FULL_40_23]OGC54767.1 MAG: hypothetical protein A3A78_05130 [candidate division WWE3 bacterium RIFCSPLOWO2_01_FULL_41_18]
MNLIISISKFRDNISEYLNEVSKGNKVIIKDEKRNIEIAEVISNKRFDKKSYEAVLRRTAGVLTSKSHPEWSTKNKVKDWIRKVRGESGRSFK